MQGLCPENHTAGDIWQLESKWIIFEPGMYGVFADALHSVTHPKFDLGAGALGRFLVLATQSMDAKYECLLGPTVIMYVYCEKNKVAIVLLLVPVDSRGQNVPHILYFG